MKTNFKVETIAGRKAVSTGTKWEPVVGYSRAVRSGDWIAVTGTIGVNPDGTIPEGAATQTRRALEIVIGAIEALGGRREDIIRTRIYTTDITLWKDIGKEHSAILGDIRPSTTMVEITRLADPAAIVEVEADAVITGREKP